MSQDGSSVGDNMSTMPGNNSVGFGPQGFAPTQHFGQHPPTFGPPIPPPLPAAAAGSSQQFDYSQRWFSLFLPTAVIQGDHLSGKPGNVREFETCQGNVRDVVNSQGNVREKILS